jgi:hypothetical protein
MLLQPKVRLIQQFPRISKLVDGIVQKRVQVPDSLPALVEVDGHVVEFVCFALEGHGEVEVVFFFLFDLLLETFDLGGEFGVGGFELGELGGGGEGLEIGLQSAELVDDEVEAPEVVAYEEKNADKRYGEGVVEHCEFGSLYVFRLW